MSKQSRRRALTGCIRRGPKHNHSSHRRAMHLSHADVGYRHLLQRCMVGARAAAHSALLTISPILILLLLTGNQQLVNNPIPNVVVAVNCILRFQHIKYAISQTQFVRWFRTDFEQHDIPLEEEDEAETVSLPLQNIRFNSWSTKTCYDNTSFTKVQLQRIYRHFGLAQFAAIDGNGYIRVSTGISDCRFHPEELFLFMMTKCKLGLTNKTMCEKIFGGNDTRWSYGYPWILEYLDIRYNRTLSHETLRDFVDDFPRFYDAIQKCIQKTTTHHFHDGTAEDRTGLNFLPFDIFGFIDCSIDRISRPFSGPDGDYIGAPRRPNSDDAQRAVYTGYKKYHGIKVETVMLPNGISTLYGPMSARPSDVGGVLQMSGLDAFLVQIQQGRPHVYSALGDGAYGANALQCVRSYFRSLVPGLQITQAERLCNQKMKALRQAIEWSYADVENIFKICSRRESYQLGTRLPYAQEQLRVCHLLSNIYVCLNGNHASSYKKFNCMPPSLDEYLHL